MVLILELKGPAGPGNVTVRSLEMTTLGACYGHGKNSFCVIWCRTAPWYGAAGMAWHPLHDAPQSGLVTDTWSASWQNHKNP